MQERKWMMGIKEETTKKYVDTQNKKKTIRKGK
jgi:hypothetical protein